MSVVYVSDPGSMSVTMAGLEINVGHSLVISLKNSVLSARLADYFANTSKYVKKLKSNFFKIFFQPAFLLSQTMKISFKIWSSEDE